MNVMTFDRVESGQWMDGSGRQQCHRMATCNEENNFLALLQFALLSLLEAFGVVQTSVPALTMFSS